MSAPRRSMGPGQRRAALILVAVACVNASYTVLIPLVPDLEGRVGAGPAVIAMAFALFAAAKAAAQPVGGWWADRWRASSVAFAGLCVAAAGTVLTALAHDGVTLLAGRVCWGAGEGLVSPALYAGMTALCQRYRIPTSRMMGNFSSAAVAGFLLGPLVAGVATGVSLPVLFLAGAALTVLTASGLLWAIPPAGPAAAPEPAAPAAGAPQSRWWLWVLLLGGLDMMTFLIYTALEPVLPLYLSAGRPDSARGAISAVLVVGLATSGLAMWALGRYAGRVRLTRLVAGGLGLLAAGLTGMGARPGVAPVAGWFVLFMVGYAALFLAARRGIMELRAAAGRQGRAFGLFGLVSDAGNIAGPVVGTVLYEVTGRLVFVLLGGLAGLLLAGLLLVLATRRRTAAPAEPLRQAA